MTDSKERDHEFNKDIGYGIEQTAVCLATDFISGPALNNKIQGGGVFKKAVGGEFIGDSASLATYIGLQRFFPGITHAIKNVTKAVAGDLYGAIGRAELKSWATRHHVAVNSAEFEQKVEEYKDVQSNNFARSGVLSLASIGFNVMAQKCLKNPNSYRTILRAKLADTAFTMGIMLGGHLAFPRFFHKLDEKVAVNVAAPVVRATQKAMGTYEGDKKFAAEKLVDDDDAPSLAEKVAQQRSEQARGEHAR